MNAEPEVNSRVIPIEMSPCASCGGYFPLIWKTPKLKGLPDHECDLNPLIQEWKNTK